MSTPSGRRAGLVLAAQLLRPDAMADAVRHVARGQLDPAVRGVLLDDADALGRRIVDAVRAGTTAFAPAPRRVVLLDKPRSLVTLSPLDLALHRRLGALLTAAFEDVLDDGVLSYRPRRGPRRAVDRLRAVAAADQRAHPDVRTRGLWVQRFDVEAYGDSVRLDDASPIWTQLDAALPDAPAWLPRLLHAAVRCGAAGEFAQRGLPNGSPVCNPLLNLYLAPVDRALAQRSDAYLRYGDDLVVVTRSVAAADAARVAADAAIAALGLRFGARKSQRLYWTGPGCAPAVPGWRGSRTVPFVGLEVGYLDAPRIATVKRRRLLGQLDVRLRHAARALGDGDAARRAAALAQAAQALLTPGSARALPTVAPLLDATSCRVQLGELDAAVARLVVRHATGAAAGRGFRQVPWRALHAAGLPSLTALRNRGRGGRRP